MRPPFIDHVTLRVRDLAASRAFYQRALEPFGVRVAALEGDRGPEIAVNNVEAVCHAGPSADERDPAGNRDLVPEDPR